MKLLPIVLLNLVTVTGALVVYDQVQGDRPASSGLVLESADVDVAEMNERIEALEAGRRPMLAAEGTDPRILDRLEALEHALGALAPETATSDETSSDEPGRVGRPPTEIDPSAPMASLDEPTADDIKRFRRLQDAVRRQEQIEKSRKRIDDRLDKLALDLTPTQREAVHAANAAFQPRIQEIWTEAKERAQEIIVNGGAINRAEITAEVNATIQQEFTATLTSVIPQSDAEAVAQALMATRGGK